MAILNYVSNCNGTSLIDLHVCILLKVPFFTLYQFLKKLRFIVKNTTGFCFYTKLLSLILFSAQERISRFYRKKKKGPAVGLERRTMTQGPCRDIKDF